jgi:hypothetical protein
MAARCLVMAFAVSAHAEVIDVSLPRIATYYLHPRDWVVLRVAGTDVPPNRFGRLALVEHQVVEGDDG